ncbi:MAG: radical SAM family heme chaperone HemW [Saprospiraceae bacterium]|nr:radical SAM family heme chaperone HemW [Saprospiraceae bacterium]
MNELSLYIHIPYCKRKCTYCNFHFSTNFSTKYEFIQSLIKEIESRKNELVYQEVGTIYFGGGTPSVLEDQELANIINVIYKNYKISPSTEITVEINPDDFSPDKAVFYKIIGINRLSIGIQSFFDDHLVWMNRSHNAIQSLQCLELLRKHSFNNVSCDLIFGIPGCTNDQWIKNIDTLMNFGIPHLSCYALTVEENTVLSHKILHRTTPPPEDNHTIEQMEILLDKIDENAYEAYEISNYCKSGFRSKHNSNYWNYTPYLGFGPSAHSFDGSKRRWNISNNNLYVKKINNNEEYYESETLSDKEKANEFVMLQLRKTEGINILDLQKIQGSENYKIAPILSQYLSSGHLVKENNNIKLSRSGKYISDRIIADLFI